MTTNNFKPILFSTEMVQAILAGRKTQTRRIAPFDKFCTKPFQTRNGKWQENYNNNPYPNKMFPDGWMAITNYKSKYQPGDILWVRETHFKITDNLRKFPLFQTSEKFLYKADLADIGCHHWKPSIFMPKEAARIFLNVTNVRVERLQDISEEDAIAEGANGHLNREDIKRLKDLDWVIKRPFGNYQFGFLALWQSINAKKHPWESNPWVWVYEFERIEKPENFLS